MIISCGEPVVVALPATGPHPRLASLADALIVAAGADVARLFRRYPGLTLVILPRPDGELIVGVRDGSLLSLRSERTRHRKARPDARREAAAAAQLAYGWWVRRVHPGSPAARRAAQSAGFALLTGRWRI